MNKEMLDKLVGDINKYIQGICRSNNDGMDEDRQWMYVQIAACAPIDMCEDLLTGVEIPNDSTHCLVVGIHTWNEDGTSMLPIDATAFPIAIHGDTCEISEDMMDECLGGGPILQGSTAQGCIEWMDDTGFASEDIYEYPELSDGYIHVCIAE